MNPTIFKGVPSANTITSSVSTMAMNRQPKNCFLCDARLQSAHIRDIDQLFYDPKVTDQHHQQLKSPLAQILTDVLEQTIQETTVHSKYVCRKCHEQCRNYENLATQLQQIRQNIQHNFNETTNKHRFKDIHMDLMEQSYETIEAIDDSGGGNGDGGGGDIDNDSNMPNMYTIESVDSAIGEVFEHENNIISNSDLVGKNTTQMKKVMLIKTSAKSGSNPFFAISHMDETIDDDQTIHAVLLEDMNESTDFGDSATNTNDGLSGESDPDHPDASEQYIMTEHLDDSKEYYETNGGGDSGGGVRGGHIGDSGRVSGDQMIEISTNGDSMTDVNYQYVFQDDDDSIDHEPDDADETSTDIPNVVAKGDLSFDATEYLKSDGDGTITFSVKSFSAGIGGGSAGTAVAVNARSKKNNSASLTAATSSTAATGSEQKQLFYRDGKKFQCLLCQPTSLVVYDPKTISIHLKTDHNERIYVCSICGLDFRKRNPYNDHMDEHMAATAAGTYECEECQESFSDSRQFRLHKKTHTASVKIWPCKACGKKYSSKNLLDEHMNMHTGARPYICPHCKKDFASKYTLTAHMKIHYDRKRPFECKECGKTFFSNQNLTQHVRTHTGVKEYECQNCGKKFGSQHNLEVHKIVHTGHKPFICRTCGKAFARRAEIKDHERTHTGERPYKCDLCTSSFAQRSNLMSHKRATHFNDKRYKCEICGRSFKRRRLLEYHTKATHTGERPYKCNECTATFVYPEHYKKHIRIHTGVKPFACETCGKTFNSRDNRNAHRFVHTEKKPYECLVCHQSFMRKPLLIAHMRTQQHGEDEFIHNKPEFQDSSKDNNNMQTITTNDTVAMEDDDDIIYLSVNDKGFIEDDDCIDDDIDIDDDDDGDGHFVHTLKEEHIVDESEIIEEEEEEGELITDNQFSGSGNDSNDPPTPVPAATTTIVNTNKHLRFIRQRQRQNLSTLSTSTIYDAMHGNDDGDDNGTNTVTYIETTEVDSEDPLHLEQICVPVDGDNESWMGLSS